MPTIGFVTCSDLSRFFPSKTNPLYTHDDQLAADDLAAHGLEPEPVIWGADVQELWRRGIRILVVRSPWDYMDSKATRDGFFEWLDLVADQGMVLLNARSLMEWNLDKHYLRDLDAAGVPIIPTTFIEADQPIDLKRWVAEHGPVVIKPAIGAAAKDAHRFMTPAAAAAFDFDTLRAERCFLLQPFMPEIMTAGEWSLVFFDGAYSHAVWKRPAPGHWLVQDELGGSVLSAEPPAAVKAIASLAMERLGAAYAQRNQGKAFAMPLYGRVDVIETALGGLIGELELVEPELFFLSRSGAENIPNLGALTRFRHGLIKSVETMQLPT